MSGLYCDAPKKPVNALLRLSNQILPSNDQESSRSLRLERRPLPLSDSFSVCSVMTWAPLVHNRPSIF